MCPAVSSAPHCTAAIAAPPSCGACSLPTGRGFDGRANDTVVVGGGSCVVADSCSGGEAESCGGGWRWLTVADVAFVLEAIELPQRVEAFARCAVTAAHWHWRLGCLSIACQAARLLNQGIISSEAFFRESWCEAGNEGSRPLFERSSKSGRSIRSETASDVPACA